MFRKTKKLKKIIKEKDDEIKKLNERLYERYDLYNRIVEFVNKISYLLSIKNTITGECIEGGMELRVKILKHLEKHSNHCAYKHYEKDIIDKLQKIIKIMDE